jgi:hypothetical protein
VPVLLYFEHGLAVGSLLTVGPFEVIIHTSQQGADMLTKDLDTKEASNAFFAARDARMRNYAMSSTYTAAERLKAERVKLALECVYRVTEVHINYRQKFIAVKLTNALVRDRASVADLEAFYAQEGIVKRETAQGTIYRIPRQ